MEVSILKSETKSFTFVIIPNEESIKKPLGSRLGAFFCFNLNHLNGVKIKGQARIFQIVLTK
jgi:hypothetical protein